MRPRSMRDSSRWPSSSYEDGRLYRMDLSYSGRHVTGQVTISSASNGALPASTESLQAAIPPRTVDQRIDWATVMATALGPGQRFQFNVYDAKTATSKVRCSIRDAGVMQTPLEYFPAIGLDYRVEKASGAEGYTVFAPRDPPRIMLREELPGGLTSKLVAME
jgi:hypothetical protein